VFVKDLPLSDPESNPPVPTSSMTQIGLRSHTDLTPSELKTVEDFASQRETAVLAIMFTDIEGFTQLTERRGDSYAITVLEAHNELLKQIVERDGRGRRIKTIGDGMLAVFSEPSVAVKRALDIQDALKQRNLRNPAEDPIRVRIGLHMGQVTVEGGVQMDIVGGHVNRAARVESLARGGQIYATQAIYENARGFVEGPAKKPVSWKAHGQYIIRGIEEPVDIFEAGIEGEVEFTSPRPGPNCKQVRLRGLTRAQQIRMMVLTAVLVLISLGIIIASVRYRVGRQQAEALSAVTSILRESDLLVSPPVEEQKKLMSALAFTEGNAALDYIRIPAMRAGAGQRNRFQEIAEEDAAMGVGDERAQLAALSDLLVTTKIHSRLVLADNQLHRGTLGDYSKPVVSREMIETGASPPTPASQALDALETGAIKTRCEFYPQIFSVPRNVQELPVFNLETVGLVHRAQIARALLHEFNGDCHQADQALQLLLRFNFHICETVNSYEELHYLMRYRRQTLLALTDMHKRCGNLDQAARWGLFLASQVTLSRNMEQAHAALFDRGYSQAQIGAKAAEHLLEKCPEEFWQIQASLCLGLTQAQRWNFFDRAPSRKALERLHATSEKNPRLHGLGKLFSSLGPGTYPPDLSFILLQQ
jgi:class 3 adenylate cyclase